MTPNETHLMLYTHRQRHTMNSYAKMHINCLLNFWFELDLKWNATLQTNNIVYMDKQLFLSYPSHF